MINKGDAAYGHPGDILCQIGNAKETCLFILFNDPAKEYIQFAENAHPPDSRIAHTAYGAYLIAHIVVGIQQGHPDKGPLIERGTVIMFRFQIGMIIKHIPGAFDSLINQPVIGGVAHHRNETQGINDEWDCHEKQAAEPM